MLVAVADELQSGVPVLGAPALGAELGLGHGVLLLAVLLSAPTLTGVVLEPFVLAWSDRADRRRVLVAALVAMAMFPLVAAVSRSPVVVALAIGLWGTACGIASGVAQGVMVSTGPSRERAMTRWTIGAAAGDLVAPLLVGGLAAFGFGWRAAVAAATLVPLVAAVRVARADIPPLVADDEPDEPLSDAVRGALGNRALLGWLVAVASCVFLDELLLALVAVRLDGEPSASVQVFGLLAGSAVGIGVAERFAEVLDGRRMLVASAATSAVALLAWLAFPSPIVGTALQVVLGASATLHYPLAMAQAHEVLPTRPGLVGALGHLLAWVDVVAPLAVGFVASTWGVEAALLVLLAQPVVLVAVALTVGRR